MIDQIYTQDDVDLMLATTMNYANKAIEAAVLAEREAIAKMFDGKVWAYDYRDIAAAIRARGEK